jgi:glycosyltransferase involved in cell wall biosynthesis
MRADPKVSVVMPVNNGEAWLAAAIDSVLAQTLADFELIVVDDGSTDTSPDIIAAASERDERIVMVRQPRQLGLVKALNAALAVARAPLLARLDADDMALPERLLHQVRCFDERSDLVLLGSWAERIDVDGRRTGEVRPETDPERLAAILQKRNPLVHSSVMMRTAMVEKLGGYREAFLGAEDFDLWLRLSEHGVVANLPQTLVRYRVHGNSVTRRLALRQCFSTRLARAAAAARANSGTDPAANLSGPPDWWAPQAMSEFYAEAAAICRFLDMADPGVIAAYGTAEVRLPNTRQLLEFSHVEKVLAQRSLVNLLTTRNRPAALPLRRLVGALATLLVGRAMFRLE